MSYHLCMISLLHAPLPCYPEAALSPEGLSRPCIARTTAIAVGVIVCLIGALIASKIPCFNGLDPRVGWPLIAGGVLLSALGLCLRRCESNATLPRDPVYVPSGPPQGVVNETPPLRQGRTKAMASELHQLFFGLISLKGDRQSRPLGDLVPEINQALESFNRKYNCQFLAVITCHSASIDDPWQTIKIIDQDIRVVGQISWVLKQWNDDLHLNFGICSNGGDEGPSAIGKQKRTPTSFIKKEKIFMKPQLLFTLSDIRRVCSLLSLEEYHQALRDAYDAYLPKNSSGTLSFLSSTAEVGSHEQTAIDHKVEHKSASAIVNG